MMMMLMRTRNWQ